MMTYKDLEIVAELAGQCLMTESDAEENCAGYPEGRQVASDTW